MSERCGTSPVRQVNRGRPRADGPVHMSLGTARRSGQRRPDVSPRRTRARRPIPKLLTGASAQSSRTAGTYLPRGSARTSCQRQQQEQKFTLASTVTSVLTSTCVVEGFIAQLSRRLKSGPTIPQTMLARSNAATVDSFRSDDTRHDRGPAGARCHQSQRPDRQGRGRRRSSGAWEASFWCFSDIMFIIGHPSRSCRSALRAARGDTRAGQRRFSLAPMVAWIRPTCAVDTG